jgi:hypothetical protein
MADKDHQDHHSPSTSTSSTSPQPTSRTLSTALSAPLPAERAAQAGLEGRTRGYSGPMDATTMAAMGDGGPSLGHAQPTLSADYYRQWREETQAKIDAGEDPYADFAQRAREHHDKTLLARMVKGFKGIGSKKWREGKGGDEVVR